jgi:phosphoribosylaminoimidazolecarboxamide formyltransferase/IMP cyclohydrolase/phosphoribosylaminoimidazolecarboxamide formyltransferase
MLADGLPGFHPLTASERETWLGDTRSICLASDAFIPFRDNIDRAARSNVTHIMQTGGSLRDGDVTAAADEYEMVMLHSGARHFLH